MFAALASLGYRPVVPIMAAQFADAAQREVWTTQKRMQVLQFWSDAHRETPVDVFVREPLPFDEEHKRALVKPLGLTPVHFVSIPGLIAMKEAAGRLQDRIDVEQLRMRLEDDDGKQGRCRVDRLDPDHMGGISPGTAPTVGGTSVGAGGPGSGTDGATRRTTLPPQTRAATR